MFAVSQAVLLLRAAVCLVEDAVHVRPARSVLLSSHSDIREEIGVELVHLVSDVRGAGDPVVEDRLWEVVKEGVDVDWWRCTRPSDFVQRVISCWMDKGQTHSITFDHTSMRSYSLCICLEH